MSRLLEKQNEISGLQRRALVGVALEGPRTPVAISKVVIEKLRPFFYGHRNGLSSLDVVKLRLGTLLAGVYRFLKNKILLQTHLDGPRRSSPLS